MLREGFHPQRGDVDGWRMDCDLTEAEKQLIEARLDDMDQHPEKSIPWAEAEARLKARFGQ